MTEQPDFPHIDADGLWCQVISPPPGDAPRPALFLDRDGVVVMEVNYLHRHQDMRLIPGAAPTVKWANDRGIPVVLVTNQSGVGRRYYEWRHFAQVQEKLLTELARSGSRLDGVFACPYHPDGRPPFDHPDHPARKPNPGMLRLAAFHLGLDLARSWIVGDRAIDLRAGLNGGLAGGMHLLTGHGARENERQAALALAGPHFKVVLGDTLADALTELPLLAD